MRCTHNTYPAGRPDDHRAAVRCEHPATHWLYQDDGQPCPGAATCLTHGLAVVKEYRAQLGETWTLRKIDEHGRLAHTQETCQHPPERRWAWNARDDRAPGGVVLCVTCCDCGAVLTGGADG
jgi:hypothetical protein